LGGEKCPNLISGLETKCRLHKKSFAVRFS
jgi:hypothetical protein